MVEAASERRLVENEVYFRQNNEDVQKQLEDLKAIAREHNQESLVQDLNVPLHFYCECSDEGCRQRIILKPSTYAKLHKLRDQFIIIPGHETPKIERIVTKKPDYSVVIKYMAPPQFVSGLNETDIENN